MHLKMPDADADVDADVDAGADADVDADVDVDAVIDIDAAAAACRGPLAALAGRAARRGLVQHRPRCGEPRRRGD